MKQLKLFNYLFADAETKHLELIKESLDDSIRCYLNALDDEEYNSQRNIKRGGMPIVGTPL